MRATDKSYSFYVMTRDPMGKQRWAKIRDGNAPVTSLAKARVLAPQGVANIKNGLPAYPKIEPETLPDSFKAVAENFIKRHVEARGLRSQSEIERQLTVYVYPRWSKRAFLDISRKDVAELMDRIEDNNGATTADRVMATLRKMMNWYQARDENYVSPIVKGMARTVPSERKRNRVLSDDEIRAIWPHLDEGTFGALVKTLLLTGQRREKVATMKWDDIADGLWTLPTEPREKNNPGSLKLARMVLDIIEAQPVIKKSPYVFTGRTYGPFAGFSPLKRELDKAAPMPHWQLHDLRRTAKTLMARAGVRPDVSERVLGHVIQGVEGVYDRHDYDDEKGKALEALATAVDRILNPPEGKVINLRAAE